jgi:hypothetical protein
MDGRNGLWLIEIKMNTAMDHVARGERLAINLSYCQNIQVLADVSQWLKIAQEYPQSIFADIVAVYVSGSLLTLY